MKPLEPMQMSAGEIDEIARLCHEVNRGYCASLRDYSQPRWEDAPEEIQNSARDGVVMILSNPRTLPEASHANWCRYKREEGWIYGTEKDGDKMTHPCLVPYEDLPQGQRSKDYIFGAIVRTAMAMIGEGREMLQATFGETGGDIPADEILEGTPPRDYAPEEETRG
mgnify:CR=1 FL=1